MMHYSTDLYINHCCNFYFCNLWTMSSKQRFKESFYMLLLHGLDTALRGIKWGSTRSSANVGNLDILTETGRLKISVLMQTNSFLTDLFITQILYSTDCYHHPMQRLNDTISELAGTHSSYRSTTLACKTVTFSLECYIKTVISTTQNHPY